MGRDPTEDEWSRVEDLTQALFQLLTPSLRKRFILGDIPRQVVTLPLVLMSFALVSLFGALIVPQFNEAIERSALVGPIVLGFYCVWLLSLGAIGAIAFIGMNALSVQEDVTFDLSNNRLISLRIVLGALFGLVLTLPFGFHDFYSFCSDIWGGNFTENDNKPASALTLKAVMLTLPFILGFSTSLVILILNRFVAAVQSFFGKGPGEGTGPASTTPEAASARNS